MLTLFVLLVVYQLKHFLADYPLQTAYMLGKFKEKDWAAPLAAHCLVHAVFTYFIAAGFFLVHRVGTPGYEVGYLVTQCYLLAAFDFAVHFMMDRVKASPKLMGRWKPLTKEQWYTNDNILHATNSPEVVAEARRALRGNTLFWWAIGFDQLVHHLTHYAVVAALVLL